MKIFYKNIGLLVLSFAVLTSGWGYFFYHKQKKDEARFNSIMSQIKAASNDKKIEILENAIIGTKNKKYKTFYLSSAFNEYYRKKNYTACIKALENIEKINFSSAYKDMAKINQIRLRLDFDRQEDIEKVHQIIKTINNKSQFYYIAKELKIHALLAENNYEQAQTLINKYLELKNAPEDFIGRVSQINYALNYK